jgi:Na+(H+)/acetate symporter ActP
MDVAFILLRQRNGHHSPVLLDSYLSEHDVMTVRGKWLSALVGVIALASLIRVLGIRGFLIGIAVVVAALCLLALVVYVLREFNKEGS